MIPINRLSRRPKIKIKMKNMKQTLNCAHYIDLAKPKLNTFH